MFLSESDEELTDVTHHQDCSSWQDGFSPTYMQPILPALIKVEKLARASKLTRLLVNPWRYGQAILFRQLIYPRTRRPVYRTCRTFFGQPLTVALPAGTDIYLTGGKTHDSEIRLAKYFINNLAAGDQVLDIGAHFGYFTLLAAQLVGQTGRVLAFEASAATYQLLQHNTAPLPQITSRQQAVSDQVEPITFYQFPMQFSEYNSRNVAQYTHESWFPKYTPEAITVPAVIIDCIQSQYVLKLKLIKIDVEGGELQVIAGAAQTFRHQAPAVVMEYLAPARNNQVHRQAYELLRQLGYRAYIISANGGLTPCSDPDRHLQTRHLDSDNLVFQK